MRIALGRFFAGCGNKLEKRPLFEPVESYDCAAHPTQRSGYVTQKLIVYFLCELLPARPGHTVLSACSPRVIGF